MNLSEYIAEVIEQQGRTKVWVADQSEINYKTFIDKLTRNTITGEELLRIAKVLNIDLEKLKGKIFKKGSVTMTNENQFERDFFKNNKVIYDSINQDAMTINIVTEHNTEQPEIYKMHETTKGSYINFEGKRVYVLVNNEG